jgi:hypothetical protein
MSRHDTSTEPDPRRGRACDACHANKTKCEGGPQCSLCAKRGVECTYKLVQKDRGKENQSIEEESPAAEEPTPPQPSTTAHVSKEDNDDHSMSGVEEESSVGDVVTTVNQAHDPDPKQGEKIDDTFAVILARLTDKIESRATQLDADFETSEEEKEWFLDNTHHYFKRFHETWPVVHGPTFFWVVENCVASSATVVMIAAWLRGQRTEWILKLHKTLCARFFEYLVSSLHCVAFV